MLEGQIERYVDRIAQEEALAARAATPDMAMAHSQTAMIYKSELAMLRRRLGNGRRSDYAQMLAKIG